MQIRITWRRLTLAVALVVAAVAAPLAWAAAGGKPALLRPSSAPAAAPASFRSAPLRSALRTSVSVSPAAALSTGDNPYHVSAIVSMPANSNACYLIGLPAGVNFAITQASVFAPGVALVQLGIQAFVKAGPTFPTDVMGTTFQIPIDSQPDGGTRSFDWVVKPNAFASAAVGDIYDVYVCAQTGSPGGRAAMVITGQKISGPTAPVVDRFTARPNAHGAQLRWTTGTETNLLGFNIWRYRNGKGVKLNRTLIQAKRSGEPTGATYTFTDVRPGARRGLTYRLQLVNLNGQRSWYTAFAIPN
jgi:hypothetical protein